MRRLGQRGSGITAYTVKMIDLANGGEAAGKLLAQQFDKIGSNLKLHGGIYRVVSQSIRELCAKLPSEAGERAMQKAFPEQSPEDLAHRIQVFLNYVDDHLEKSGVSGDLAKPIDLALRYGFNAGAEASLFRMKQRWDADALRGEKIAKAARQGAAMTEAANTPLARKRAERMHQLLEDHSLSRAAQLCELDGLGSAGAILRQWRRHNKKSHDTPGIVPDGVCQDTSG